MICHVYCFYHTDNLFEMLVILITSRKGNMNQCGFWGHPMPGSLPNFTLCGLFGPFWQCASSVDLF